MLPVVQVSRLPSASSFYAAITQPLDIHYLTPPPLLPAPALSSSSSSSSSSGSTLSFSLAYPSPSKQSVIFGTADSRRPLFQLCPVTDKPFRASYLVLSANSVDEVHAFRAAALRADPRCAPVIGTRASLDSDSATVVAASVSLDSSEVCARVTDSDGNTMEVAYRPSLYYSSYYDSPSASRHHDTGYGERRVLHWSQSSPDTDLHYGRRGSNLYGADMPADYAYYSDRRATLRRSATDTPSTSYGLSTQNATKGESRSSGVGVVGMLGMAAMGAAAGAALTYSVMSSRSRSQTRSARERERAYEEATAVPAFRRQATLPAALPAPYEDYAPAPAPSRASGYEGMRGTSTTSRREMRALLPEPYEYDDGRSRYTAARSYAGEGSRVRGHSEAPRSRTPLLTMGEDSYRSIAGSRRGSVVAGPPPPPPSIKRSSTYDHASRVGRSDRSERGDRRSEYGDHRSEYRSEHRSEHRSERGDRDRSDRDRSDRDRDRGERASHVSSRSHRTVRASEHGSRAVPAMPPNASRSASVRQGRPGSYVSARHVPLPQSGTGGSSHGRWDVPEYLRDEQDDRDDRYERDDEPMIFDDCDSVAPSDSISCVGSRRRRHH